MIFIPFFNPPFQLANSRYLLDFPLGLLALMAGSASLWIPYGYSHHELGECDDFCLKGALNSVTIAIVLTMAGFHLMDD